MSNKTIAERLGSLVQARLNCLARVPVNDEWRERHEARALALVKEHLPSGSGFDCGTDLDLERSTGDKLVFKTSFHHMDEHGGYAGWSTHDVFVTPSFVSGLSVDVKGRDRNQIKDYIGEAFAAALSADAPAETL